MADQEIKQCLTMLQQAFSCPICLDYIENPRISPCSHIFCNHCLEKNHGGKTSTTCPICKREFSTRAFTYSHKFHQVSKTVKEIIENYAEESQTDFVPVTRFDPLHLSQEFSQVVPQIKETPQRRNGPRFSKPNPRLDQLAKTTKRAPAALVNRIRARSRKSTNFNDDSKKSLLANQTDEIEPYKELFTMTQTPLPVEPNAVNLSEFPDLSIKASKCDDDLHNRQDPFPRQRRPGLFSAVRKRVFRSFSRERKRRLESPSPESRSSTVSVCSVIPPLRERLSLLSAPIESKPSPKLRGRKCRRLSSELYSPWLRNSRMHFLKKYRIPPQPTVSRSASSELAGGRSPSWLVLKNLGGDMIRSSRHQLPLRISSKKKTENTANATDKSSVTTANESRKGLVCRFSLPSATRLFKEIPPCAPTFPSPCPQIHAETSYFPDSFISRPQSNGEEKNKKKSLPENGTPVGRQAELSPAATSVATIQPSYIPQTFSLNSKSSSVSGKSSPSTINIQPSVVPQSLSFATPAEVDVEGPANADSLNLTLTLVEAKDIHPLPLPSSSNTASHVPEMLQTQTSGSVGCANGATKTGDARVSLVKNNIEPKESASANLVVEPPDSTPQFENGANIEMEEEANCLQKEPEKEVTMVDAREMKGLLAEVGTETIDVEEAPDGQGVISASPTPPPIQSTVLEPSKVLDHIHGSTIGDEAGPPHADEVDEDVDIIPSSQNEEQATVEAINATLVARVESSQDGVPAPVVSFGPLPITVAADTMPFTQTSCVLQTSVIADTENTSKNDEEPTQPTIFITGSNLTAEQAVSWPLFVGCARLAYINVNLLYLPQQNAVHRFCSKFHAMETLTFDPAHTTHVVITTSDSNPHIATRTLKYFMAVLYGTWLVNPLWIRDCLRENKILSEEPYEIRGDLQCESLHDGPRRGRLRISSFPTPHFSSNIVQSSRRDRRPFIELVICPFQNISPLSMNDLEAIVVAGGGTFVQDITNVDVDVIRATRESLTNSDSLALPVDGRTKCLIVTQPRAKGFKKADCAALFEQYNVPIVSVSWLLNCAASYSRLTLTNFYCVCARQP
ncbi:hypothetical protein Aperf_G00000129088 [Anoplocephala perfoliata]